MVRQGTATPQPCLDLFGEERKACENELAVTENVLSNISNILLFSDVTTLYFEANREDDLRKTGFRKKTATRTRK